MKHIRQVSLGLILVIFIFAQGNVFALENNTIDVKAGIEGSMLVDDNLLIPLRSTGGKLGIDVKWDIEKKAAIVNNVEITPNSTKGFYKGSEIDFPIATVVKSGKMFVPLRLFEYLGAVVEVNDDGDAATISYSPEMQRARELYGIPVEGEQDLKAKLDYKYAWDFAVKLSGFQDAVNDRGFHLAGSPAGHASAKYIFDTFKEIGLNPEYDEFPITSWTYYSSSINVQDHPELSTLPITAAPYTPGTGKDGLKGQVVDVGTASKDELAGIDLKGKIALVNLDMDVHFWMNTAAYQCEQHGAAGVIYYSTKYHGTHQSGEAEFVGDWTGKRSNIPVWVLPQKYGMQLSEAAKKSPLQATVFANTKMDEKATGKNVLATIKGHKHPDEYIIINAHHDAYFKSLQDDSIGVGIMMALAKAMVDSGYEPDHSIVFVATDGEEAGAMDTSFDWLQGSWNLVTKKIDSWGGKIVNAHTSEMVAYKEESFMSPRVSDVMLPFTIGSVSDVAVEGYPLKGVVVTNFMTTGADWWSFNYYGAPTTRNDFQVSDEVNHSRMDTVDSVDYNMYMDEVKLTVNMIVRLDRQPLAPYDLSVTVQKYIDNIDNDALNSQGYDDKLLKDTTAFRDKAAMFFKQQLNVAKMYQTVKMQGLDTKKVDEMLPSYNQAMRDAAKKMIMGTDYLALTSPIYQTIYYQTLPRQLQDAINYLKADNGKAMLENFNMNVPGFGQYYQDYVATLEKETWKTHFREALNPENPENRLNWAAGRLLKYYDIYDVIENVKMKSQTQGIHDYSAEIAALEKMNADATERLAKAYSEDDAMWNQVNEQLPVQKLHEIQLELETLLNQNK